MPHCVEVVPAKECIAASSGQEVDSLQGHEHITILIQHFNVRMHNAPVRFRAGAFRLGNGYSD